jgi:hypothetical protein
MGSCLAVREEEGWMCACPLQRMRRTAWLGIWLKAHARRLTFDMRGDRKAQPFGHPLDGRVRRHCGARLIASAASIRVRGGMAACDSQRSLLDRGVVNLGLFRAPCRPGKPTMRCFSVDCRVENECCHVDESKEEHVQLQWQVAWQSFDSGEVDHGGDRDCATKDEEPCKESDSTTDWLIGPWSAQEVIHVTPNV